MIVRGPILWLALLTAACGEPGEDDRPLDGGHPLRGPVASENLEGVVNRACFRAERGRWHYSVGHCEAMLPAREIEGVWVTAFEETSFLPGAREKPEPLDPRRFMTEIELDDEAIFRAIRRTREGPEAEAVHLRFKGRRTRDPLSVDCYGGANFVYVLDDLIEARYLGRLEPIPNEHWQELARNRPPPTVKQVHGGRWGELEADAVKHCRGGRRADQIEGQSSPPGKSSAE